MKSPDTTAILLPPAPVSFRMVAGIPLIQRNALGALRAGFTRVIALADGDAGQLRALFDRDPRTRAIPVLERDAAATTAMHPDAVLIPPDVLLLPTSKNGGAVGAESIRVTETNLRAAEDRLIEEIRHASAPTDGPIARFDRAISTRLSRALVRTPLRPNHITIIGTTVGLLAGWSFVLGSYAAGVVGALLFWIAIIVDGCDGEVARLTFQESEFGARFDVVTDNVVHVAIFLGLGIGYARTHAGMHPWLPSLFLVVGFIVSMPVTWFCLLRNQGKDRDDDSPLRRRFLQGFELLMNRDFAYLLVALAVIGRLSWFLWGAAFGVWAYTAGLLVAHNYAPARAGTPPWHARLAAAGRPHGGQILFLLGVLLLIFLVWQMGWDAVGDNLRLVGWAFVPILAQELLAYGANTLGWRAAFPPGVVHGGFFSLLAARIAGDAVNTVTPTATIGGEVVRVQLLRGRVDSGSAWASVTVARMSQAVGQVVFVIVGLLIVTRTVPLVGRLYSGVWAGLMAFVIVLVAAVVAQRRGMFTGAVHLANRLGLQTPVHWLEGIRGVDIQIGRIYERPQAFVQSVAWYVVGWGVGVIEIYIILYCFGLASWERALAIETLTVVIDGLLFFVPAKVGTQEGGKVLIFSLLGLDPVKGLALGIVRRLRELTWAAIGLGILALHQRAHRSETA